MSVTETLNAPRVHYQSTSISPSHLSDSIFLVSRPVITLGSRLREVPHFSSGIVERSRVKITPRERTSGARLTRDEFPVFPSTRRSMECHSLGGQQTGHQLQTDMRQTWLWCKFYNLLNKDLILEIIENKAQPQRIEGIYTPLCCQL